MQNQLNIKRVDLGSLFKVAFLIYGAIGLLAGLLYAFFALVVGSVGSAFMEEDMPFGLIGGVLALVLVPVIAFAYGAIGSVFITVVGALFNLVTKVTGGVKFDVEEVAPPRLPTPPVSPE